MLEGNKCSKKYGLQMNVRKTKVMIISPDGPKDVDVIADGEKLEQVLAFQYLGSRITCDGSSTSDIRQCLAMATTALRSLQPLWKGQDKATILQVLCSCVFPVATYGCESWTLKASDPARIQAFDHKCYRRVLRIPWVRKRTNASVRREMEVPEDSFPIT